MTVRRLVPVLVFSLAAVLAGLTSGPTPAAPNTPDPSSGFLLNGRQLTPQGAQVALGNFPTGGAVTADGRFLWTVSAGQGANDMRIVDTVRGRVCQIIPMSGASGGIALDSGHRRAYISAVSASRWWPTQAGLPGAAGNCVLVYGWNASSGRAWFINAIPVPPQPGAPPVQAFPIPTIPFTNAWPQKLAVSPDGSRLLVPLNLAGSADVIDLKHDNRVRNVVRELPVRCGDPA
jgi:DNA-binding beta-propeller fold protein YncE